MVCLICWYGKLGYAYVCERFRLNTLNVSEDTLSILKYICVVALVPPVLCVQRLLDWGFCILVCERALGEEQ